ncbi:MAG: UvrD-helicase domain-containing protein [Bacteroidales bacterium]|nr:UvrD-helicase domain-containing protein [Bacteroidales bacterium]
MSNNIILDKDIREDIKNILDVNMLVEAGAGSGKTTSMINRMVSLIVSGRCKVENIAAITFTRKAAQELKERFQNHLEQCYRDEEDSEIKSTLKEALNNMQRCFIGTIHSFCASILRERPIEGAVDPKFEELDDIADALIHKQSWQQYLLDIRLNYPEKLAKLNDCGIKPADLEGIFYRITDYPDVEIVCDETLKPDIAPSYENMKPLFYEAIKYIPKTEPEKGYDGLQSKIRSALRMIRYYDMDNETNIVNLLEMFESDQKVTLNRWLCDKEITKKTQQDINYFSQTQIRPVLKQWREYCHYIAMEFLMPAIEFYESLKSKQAGLNFQDLLLKAVNMLKNYPEVRTYFQNKYHCLLIDEFQDTDPIQTELMLLLTGQDTNEKQWSKLVPSPGSLFVVGDPKQSIYRFRRADIDIYNGVKQLFMQTGGRVVELTSNFRSMNTLGEWFDKVFKNLLPSKADSFQAAFSAVNTLNDDLPGTHSGVKVINIPIEYTKKQEILQCDAEYIAKVIRNAVDGQGIKLTRTEQETVAGLTEIPEYKDFLVLLRYKDSIDMYSKTLKQYGIPVQLSGGSSLLDVEELKEFIILLKYLKDPENKVLLVAVLRGIFFGISDRALAEYKLAGGAFRTYATIPEGLNENTNTLFATAYEKLKMYHRWSRNYHPVTTFEKIASDIGLIPLAAIGNEAKTSCGYIVKILEILRKNMIDNSDYNSMIDSLDAIMDADLEEELDISQEEQNAVRIMNLHKAKGLEAPVVFLAHPFKRPNIAPDHHIKRTELKSEGYFVIKKSTGEFSSKVIGQPLNWDEYEQTEQAYQEAEETRLLYVAATRAKNILLISSSEKSNRKNPWEPLLDFTDTKEDIYDIPDVQIPKQKPSEKPVETPVQLKKEDFYSFKKQIEDFIILQKEPTYLELSVTDIISDEPLHTVKGGLGPVWGSAIHEIIEHFVKDEAHYNHYKKHILSQYGFTEPIHIEKADELISKFKDSSLYSRIQKADVKLTEVLFSIKLDSNDEIYRFLNIEKALPVYLQGIIDLAIKENDTWSIIDYKTNYFETDEDLKLLVDHYSKQIKLYCMIWNMIIKQRAQSGELYFTGYGSVKVDL